MAGYAFSYVRQGNRTLQLICCWSLFVYLPTLRLTFLHGFLEKNNNKRNELNCLYTGLIKLVYSEWGWGIEIIISLLGGGITVLLIILFICIYLGKIKWTVCEFLDAQNHINSLPDSLTHKHYPQNVTSSRSENTEPVSTVLYASSILALQSLLIPTPFSPHLLTQLQFISYLSRLRRKG